MANDGSTKAKAKWASPKDVTNTADTTGVSGLTITRDGTKFTATWKNGASYVSGSVIYRIYVGSAWKEWSSPAAIPSGDTSKQFYTVDWSKYYPASGKPELKKVQVRVAVRQPDTDWETKYKQVTEKNAKGKSVKVWYKWRVRTVYTYATTDASFDIKVPKKPSVTATGGTGATTFNYSVGSAENDSNYVFRSVGYSKKVVQNWGTKSAETYTDWGADSSKSTASGDYSQNFGYADITTMGMSKSVLTRIRSRGPEGDSEYAYATVCYAKPKQAKDISAVVTNQSTGYAVTAKWSRVEDSLFPAPQYKVEYYIGTPVGTSYSCPAGVSWSQGTGVQPARSGTAQSAAFSTTARIADEQYMWIRVVQILGELETPSEPAAVVTFSTLKAPSIGNISYNAQTGALSVPVTNNSAFTCTNTVYLNGTAIGSVSGSGTVTATRALGPGTFAFTVSGTYWGKTSSTGRTTFNTAKLATYPTPYYPTGLSIVKKSGAGTAQLSWTPRLQDDNDVESIITIADNPNEWSVANPDFIDTITIGGNVTTALIQNLSYNTPYYFKVQSKNSKGTTGYSQETVSITLDAATAPTPSIEQTATETADHGIQVSWDWGVWPGAEKVQIAWSTNQTDGNTDRITWTAVEKQTTAKQYYVIPPGKVTRGKTWYIWARFVQGNTVSRAAEAKLTLTITPQTPTGITFVRDPQTADVPGQTTARLSWTDAWVDTVKTEVSWSEDSSAWEKTTGATTHTINGKASTVLIPGLTLGKTYYARVKVMYNDEYFAQTALVALDLRTRPSTPVVSISKDTISQYGKTDVSWTYDNEDLSAQAAATVYIYDDTDTEVGRQGISGSDKAVTLYMETFGLTGDATYTVRVQTISANEEASEMSAAMPFNVINVPICEITATSLVDVAGETVTIHQLQAMPLTITVSGATHNGNAFVYIVRTKSIFLDRPDESTAYGYEGELVISAETGPDGEFTITQGQLYTDFVDGGEYRIVATVTNEVGMRSEPVEIFFTVAWTHQALIPEATYVTDPDNYIAKITPIQPAGAEETDTFDIYRLSADKPELIVADGIWGETYVDPYPAFGDNMGHRIVYKTETGDYTTADGDIAWLDCIPPYDVTEQPTLVTNSTVINFANDHIELDFNMDISHTWKKDFTETKYLGGAVQGDWNPAVSRTGTINGAMLTFEFEDDIARMRRLAAYPGICHVRTPDGSSFAADIQVQESRSSDTAGRIVKFQLSITRVDSEELDGMTLEEWEALNPTGATGATGGT